MGLVGLMCTAVAIGYLTNNVGYGWLTFGIGMLAFSILCYLEEGQWL